MKGKKILIITLVALFLLIGGANVLYENLEDKVDTNQLPNQEVVEEGSTEEKTPAPDFTVYDKEGNEVKLSDFAGKPVVLNFWASWCGPCKIEMPDFQKQYEARGEEIAFLMINMTDGNRETVEAASNFIEEAGYSFPVVYDTSGEAAEIYGIYSLPTTLFIDKEGYVAAYAMGAMDGESLQRGIDMISDNMIE